jgi:hypothetical protein
MILRRWRGAVRAADAEAYLRHQDQTCVRDYRATEGNLGALVLSQQRDDGLVPRPAAARTARPGGWCWLLSPG